MERLTNWLETRWVNPAYSGWLLMGLSVFFFGAASNTMAGWLYVMSGTIMAILAIAAVLPPRSLQDLQVKRLPIAPVSAGQPIVVEVSVTNRGKRAKELLQMIDLLPFVLGQPERRVIDSLSPGQRHDWVYVHPTQQRGIYTWKELQLRTAAPLGLFWCRRSHAAKAQAIVYPQILSLNACPLLDNIGETSHVHVEQYARSNQSHEGFTRALRPYRWGDPIRLVHWRTSARYGELRVRELEILTGGEEVVIAIDPDAPWSTEQFEQAVIVAATLYDYGDRNGMSVGLWTAESGVVHPREAVLTRLAEIQPHPKSSPSSNSDYPLHIPMVWLTASAATPKALADGSRSIHWTSTTSALGGFSVSVDGLDDLDELAVRLQQDEREAS